MVILFWNVVPYHFIFLSFGSVSVWEEKQKQGSLHSSHNNTYLVPQSYSVALSSCEAASFCSGILLPVTETSHPLQDKTIAFDLIQLFCYTPWLDYAHRRSVYEEFS